MYSGLMVVITVIFGIMAHFYVYVDVAETQDEEEKLSNGIQLQDKTKEDEVGQENNTTL